MQKKQINERAAKRIESIKDYAQKFRGNNPDMGTGNAPGAKVAPPTIIRHMIGVHGRPEGGSK